MLWYVWFVIPLVFVSILGYIFWSEIAQFWFGNWSKKDIEALSEKRERNEAKLNSKIRTKLLKNYEKEIQKICRYIRARVKDTYKRGYTWSVIEIYDTKIPELELKVRKAELDYNVKEDILLQLKKDGFKAQYNAKSKARSTAIFDASRDKWEFYEVDTIDVTLTTR